MTCVTFCCFRSLHENKDFALTQFANFCRYFLRLSLPESPIVIFEAAMFSNYESALILKRNTPFLLHKLSISDHGSSSKAWQLPQLQNGATAIFINIRTAWCFWPPPQDFGEMSPLLIGTHETNKGRGESLIPVIVSICYKVHKNEKLTTCLKGAIN